MHLENTSYIRLGKTAVNSLSQSALLCGINSIVVMNFSSVGNLLNPVTKFFISKISDQTSSILLGLFSTVSSGITREVSGS